MRSEAQECARRRPPQPLTPRYWVTPVVRSPKDPGPKSQHISNTTNYNSKKRSLWWFVAWLSATLALRGQFHQLASQTQDAPRSIKYPGEAGFVLLLLFGSLGTGCLGGFVLGLFMPAACSVGIACCLLLFARSQQRVDNNDDVTQSLLQACAASLAATGTWVSLMRAISYTFKPGWTRCVLLSTTALGPVVWFLFVIVFDEDL